MRLCWCGGFEYKCAKFGHIKGKTTQDRHKVRTAAFENDKVFMKYASELRNAVYTATDIYERLEGKQLIYGNGHHIRQKLAEMAVDILKDRWINE